MKRAELFCAFVRVFVVLAILQPVIASAQGASPRKQGWWQEVPLAARTLQNCVDYASNPSRSDKERNPARICAGSGFLTGQGLPQGQNLDLAEYWFRLAREKGEPGLGEPLALIEVLKKNPNYESAAALMRGAIEKEGLLPARLKNASKACEDRPYCDLYMQFLMAYFKAFVQYPVSARIRGEEGAVVVEINLATRSTKVKNNSLPPKFSEAILAAFKGAFVALPMPEELDVKSVGIVETPIAFALSD